MNIRNLPVFSFREAIAAIRQQPVYRHHTSFLWQRCLSIRNQFCEAVVCAELLSFEQMVNASCRYCIGASRRGGVIFWQIDHEGRVHDGKVMYYQSDCHRNKSKAAHPIWVSTFLAHRHGSRKSDTTSHCFFGQHLLSANPQATCAIVEAEKTAFILSELYPGYLWLAAGGLGEVQPDKFRALRGHKVILFPDTDPDGIAFHRWTEAATLVMNAPFWEGSPPIRVSPILELHATKDQKRRKIDLIDFIFEQNGKQQP